MEQQKRVNWVLVITGVLLPVSIGIFIFQFISKENKASCHFEGHEIQYGSAIVSSTGQSCVCLAEGKMKCEESQKENTQESFSTENLVFEYCYLNTISESTNDLSRVQLTDVNQNGKELAILFDREALCNEDFEAPSQAGYYEKYDNKLVLSTITSSDTDKFNIPCLVSNSFKFSDFDFTNMDNLEIYYRNEKGTEFNLMVCMYNGMLYGEGDIFSGKKGKPVCNCKGGEVVCD